MHLQSNIHVPIIYTSAHAYAYACTHVSSIAVHTVVLYSSAHCSRTCFSRTCSASTPYYAIYTCLGTAHRSGLVIYTVHVIYTEESGRDLHRGEETNPNQPWSHPPGRLSREQHVPAPCTPGLGLRVKG